MMFDAGSAAGSVEAAPRSPLAAWPEILAVGLLIVLGWSAWGSSLHHDAVWQLWIGRQLLDGAELYRDILEVNPPLWFWTAVPLSWAAGRLDLSPDAVLIAGFLASAAFAQVLLWRLVAWRPARQRALLHLACLTVMLALPGASFAQREHFALIAALPWVFLTARRAEGKAVSAGLAFGIGLFAAAGLGLKPHFLLAPLALETWLALGRGRTGWRWLRPETAALALALLAYGAAIFLLTPDYLSRIVPMVRAAYGAFGRGYADMLTPALLLWPAVLVMARFWRRPLDATAVAAYLASVAFLLAYLIQQKGWAYQFLPALGMLIVTVGAQLAAEREPRRTRAAASAGAALALTAAALAGPYANSSRAPVERALAGVAPGRPVLIVSAHPSRAWPMVEARGLRWASRYYSYWMLPAIARAARAGSGSPELMGLAAAVRRDAAADLRCFAPDLVLIDAHRDSGLMAPMEFDTLAFFRGDPAFRAAFGAYRFSGEVAGFDSYRRVAASDPSGRAGCVPRFSRRA